MHKLRKITWMLAAVGLCTNAQAIELVTDGDTSLKIGGFVKAEGIFAYPDDKDNSFKGNMRESRINLEVNTLVEDKKLKGFIEGDFYGDYANGSSDLRLRHAYLQMDNLTIGKTWSGQFYAAAPLLTEQLDFYGGGLATAAGTGLTIRPDLTVHYTKNGLRLTAQDPIYDHADYPDLVASYRGKVPSFGESTPDIDYIIAVMGRDVSTGVQNSKDSDLGIGASLTGRLNLDFGSLHASIFTGEGMGVYSGVCVTGPLNPAILDSCDAENGKLVSQTGYRVGYKHKLTPKLSSNMRYGKVKVDDSADTSLEVKSINLIYNYLPDVDFGIELRDRSETTVPWRQAGQEVEVMAKYTF